ncbi:hypothetical protein MKEN_00281300 [Mycena kentingensis (nom. inval.)]|nr:hypothetical protein MKEN_00281300 [Mycena kentingensis (nom. inval.)]
MASRCSSFFPLPVFAILVQHVAALAFNPVGGPFSKGAQIPVSWTLDGTEPAGGWDLVFLSSNESVAAQFGIVGAASTQNSALVAFPGFEGIFQGRVGDSVLASSTLVNVENPAEPLVISSSSALKLAAAATTIPNPNTNTNTDTKPPPVTGPLLGIIIATGFVFLLAIIAFVVFRSQRRRRRLQAEREEAITDSYPFAPSWDAEKQMRIAEQIDPFPSTTASLRSVRSFRGFGRRQEREWDAASVVSESTRAASPASAPLRGQSIAQVHLARNGAPAKTISPRANPIALAPPPAPATLPPSPPMATSIEIAVPAPVVPAGAGAGGDSRRAAYLNAQLQKLELPHADSNADADEVGSVMFKPLSSVPSATTVGWGDRDSALGLGVGRDGSGAPPSAWAAKREIYLSREFMRMDNAERAAGAGGAEVQQQDSLLSRTPSNRSVVLYSTPTKPNGRQSAGTFGPRSPFGFSAMVPPDAPQW